MALWQVGFFVLPKRSLDLSDKFELSDGYNFDDAPFWEPLQLDPNFFDAIKSILPKGKSWSKSIMLYGEENSNRLEVFFENNIIVSVSFRIDFTSNYEPIVRQLIEFCILNNLIILDEELNVVPLNYEQAKSIIENAPQVKKYNELSKSKKA